ncbi:hypothetical protein QR680_001591 [Steinernema hermaphroditum]|uniref:Hook C-terminal domain-containing protein n=1 Tax=Steinernema hermaphroditum TaxID=289476 RepID=A0AA39H0K5_9BILA|nr:hypothetical protein QR680_001591 [Steinernema hermaphroditum]
MLQESDRTHIEKLLVLTFSAATLGPRSQEFVGQLNALQLKSSVQKELIAVISEINRDMPQYGQPSVDLNRSNSTEVRHQRSLSDLENDNTRLNTIIDSCKATIQLLTNEKEDLLSHLNESNAKLVDLEVAQQEALNYKNSVSQLKDHVRRLDDICYQKEVEQQKSLNEITRCHEIIKQFENSKTDELISHLKDENLNLSTQVQILNERLDAAEHSMSENDGLRLRLKEVNTLRSENKVLREKLETYITTAVALEDEKRINEALKVQIEQLKLNMSDVEVRLTAETVKAEQAVYDLAKARTKLESMEIEKNELIVEQVRLKDEIRRRGSPTLELDLEMSGHSPSTLKPLNADERSELEMESERLRSAMEQLQKEHCEEKEKLERQILELNTELRISKEKIAQLENEASNARMLYESSKASVEDRIHSEQMSVTVVRLERELRDASKSIEEFQKTVADLNNELASKAEELHSSKRTYMEYLEKARIAIIDMEASYSSSPYSTGDCARLEREIKAKDRKIAQLIEQLDTSRVLNEQEQRLLTTSCYKMFSERSCAFSTADSPCSTGVNAHGPVSSSHKWSSAFTSTSMWILIALVSALISAVLYLMFNQQKPSTWKRGFVPT